MEKDKIETQTAEELRQEENEAVCEQETQNDELSVITDKYLRLAAEYDNFRKRTAREREGVYSDATVAAVRQFLPVLDSLDRAMKALENSDEAERKGVELTRRQFLDTLDRLKVCEIKALGERFDPSLHNAVLHIEDEAVDEQTIIEVFEKGYRIGDKVIRYATVKVAN